MTGWGESKVYGEPPTGLSGYRRLTAGTISAALLGFTPIALAAPANADGQTYTPVITATLNISDSPFDPPYMYGGGFYVSGSITDPTGIEGPSGGQAFLQVLTASNPVWTTIAVDDSPSYLFFDADFIFTENAQYKVVFTGSTALGTWDDSYVAGESTPTTRKVVFSNPKGTLIKGKVTPNYGTKKIKIQKKVGTKWTRYKTFKTTESGTYRFRLPAPRRGKTQWKKSGSVGGVDLVERPEDAELVALRVGEDDPPGAGAMRPALVGDLGGAEREHPGDLLVAGARAGPDVEVDPLGRQHGIGHLDEEDRMTRPGVEDHALLVARQVGVAVDVDVAQQALPPLGELEGVVAVDRGVCDEGGHAVPLRRTKSTIDSASSGRHTMRSGRDVSSSL